MFNFIWSSNKTNRNAVSFEDIKKTFLHKDQYLLINTLPNDQQDYLIQNTIISNEEEKVMNSILYDSTIPDKPIIIYGKHSCDHSVYDKMEQLKNLGLKDIYIYVGGLFEWLCLREIYGIEEFPLNRQFHNDHIIDLLKYSPKHYLS